MDFVSLIKDSPIAIAIIVVIGLFLKFLRDERIERAAQSREERAAQAKRDEAFEARAAIRNKLFADTVRDLSDQAVERAKECHDIHMQSIKTIERNTEALDEMQQAVHRLVAERRS